MAQGQTTGDQLVTSCRIVSVIEVTIRIHETTCKKQLWTPDGILITEYQETLHYEPTTRGPQSAGQ